MAQVATRAKAAMGALLAGSMLLTAMPAAAQYRGGRGDYNRDRDGIGAGEIIAGAVVLGGLAAILSSSNGRYRDGYDNGRYDGRYNNGYDWQRYGGSRQAIEQCVSAVERGGRRRDNVDVTRITDVSRARDGYRVEGRVAVDYRGNDDWRGRDGDWRGRDNRYSARDRYDDRGTFSCTVRYGRIDRLNVRGI